MENWGPFYGESNGVIDFKPNENGSLFLIHGNNARGKTTILRAFVYALFGVDKHTYELKTNKLQRDIAKLSDMFNEKAQEDDKDYSLRVELSFEHSGIDYLLTREASSDKKPTEIKDQSKINQNLYLRIKGENNRTLEDDQADDYIRRNIIDPDLRDFFFFDGEEVYNFQQQLKTKKPEDLEDRINLMLGLKHIDKACEIFDQENESYEKKVRGIDQKVKENKTVLETIANLESELKDTRRDISDQKEIIEESKKELAEIEEELKSDNDAKELAIRAKHIEQDIVRVQKDKQDLEQTLRMVVFNNWLSPLESSKKFSDLGRLNKAISDSERKYFEDDLITKTIRSKKLWGANLNTEIIKDFRKHKEKLDKEVSETRDKVASLQEKSENIIEMKDAMASESIYNEEQAILLNEIRQEELERELKKIDKELEGIQKHKFPAYAESRDKLIASLSKQEDALQDMERDENEQSEWIKKKSKQLEQDDSPTDEKTRLNSLIYEALAESFLAAKDPIIEIIKEKVENDTSQIFNEMDSNKDRIGIDIKSDYSLEVKREGRETAIMKNATQELVMTLSLLMGISINAPGGHPVVIDTPLGKVDSVESKQIYKGLGNYGEQIILLVQDTEWAEENRKELSSYISGEVTLTRARKNDSTLSKITKGHDSEKLEYM